MMYLKRLAVFMMLVCVGILAGCGGAESAVSNPNAEKLPDTAVKIEKSNVTETKEKVNMAGMRHEVNPLGKFKITVGDKVFYATLEDNATTKAFVDKLPATLHMENLYGREMCYRYGAGGLAEAKTRNDRYEVGDIVYWPPRGSLVILYKQNGEEFERVQLGHIDGDVSFFSGSGDAQVKFELVQS